MQQMSIVSFVPLLLGGFILISVPGEAVIYYVTPTEPPNSDCPGEPCQTLDYYFSHGDRYLSSEKINVTMILLHGKHNLNNHLIIYIQNLETFEMIGMEPAHDVVVQLSIPIELRNVTTSYIGTLTIIAVSLYHSQLTFLSDFDMPATTRDRLFVVNETVLSSVTLFQFTIRPTNFSIVVANSTFKNQSALTCVSEVDLDNYYIRRLKMTQCTFSNSTLYLQFSNVRITIDNSTFKGTANDFTYSSIHASYSNIIFAGNVHFSSTGNTIYGPALLSYPAILQSRGM